jgi:hypothetical protein
MCFATRTSASYPWTIKRQLSTRFDSLCEQLSAASQYTSTTRCLFGDTWRSCVLIYARELFGLVRTTPTDGYRCRYKWWWFLRPVTERHRGLCQQLRQATFVCKIAEIHVSRTAHVGGSAVGVPCTKVYTDTATTETITMITASQPRNNQYIE